MNNYEELNSQEKRMLEEERREGSFNKNKISIFSTVIMIIFGVLFPIIAFGTNLFLIPFPFSCYSPELYLLLFLGFCGITLTALNRRGWNKPLSLFAVLTTFLSLVYSSLFSLIFIPLIPISLMAIMFVGLGLLGFSPFLSLWASLIAVRRSFMIASDYYKKTTLIYSCIVFVIILPLFYIGARTAFSYSQKRLVYQAVHTEDEAKKIEMMKEIRNKPGIKTQLVKYYAYHNGTPYDTLADLILCIEKNCADFYFYDYFSVFDQFVSKYAVTSQEASEMYYLLYGEKIEKAEKETLKKIRVGYWASRGFYDYVDTENYWSAVYLENCHYDGVINLDAGTVYQEVTMNVGAEWDKQEMVCEFKVPPGGVVTKLSLWINGEEQLAAITGKEKAENAYETIVSTQRDPAIITWLGGNRYRLNVFPVEKNLPRKVRFGITSPLFPGEKGLTFIPVSFVSRNFKLNKETVTTSIVDIRSKETDYKVTSPSDGINITPLGKGEKRTKIEIDGFSSEGLELFIEPSESKEKILAWQGKNYTYLQCILKPSFSKEDRPPVNVTYFLDSTYPMKKDGFFDDAKKAIADSMGNLKKEDTFNIIAVNYEVKKLFPSPREVSEESVKEAKEFLGSIEAEGGIDLLPAVEENFYPQNYDRQPVFLGIIHSSHPLLTGGNLFFQETDRMSYVEYSDDSIIMGLVMVDYDQIDFLENLVSKTGGEIIKVKEKSNFKNSFEKIESFAFNTKIMKVMCNVKGMDDFLTVPYVEDRVTSLEPASFYIRVPKDKKLSGKITLTDGNDKVLKEFDLNKDIKIISDDHIGRLWAYNYIIEQYKKDLKNELSDEEFGETVKMGMDYYMVTPYTSLIVLETAEQYRQFDIDKNYEGEMTAPSIPEPESIFMFIIILLLTLFFYVKTRKKPVNI